METSLHCPFAAAQRELILKTGSGFYGLTIQSPRRHRRFVQRQQWRAYERFHASFQEAWRAFNSTLKGEVS